MLLVMMYICSLSCLRFNGVPAVRQCRVVSGPPPPSLPWFIKIRGMIMHPELKEYENILGNLRGAKISYNVSGVKISKES